MSDTCHYCRGRGHYTAQDTYRYGDTVSRPCFCQRNKPDEPRGPSSDELLYGPRRATK